MSGENDNENEVEDDDAEEPVSPSQTFIPGRRGPGRPPKIDTDLPLTNDETLPIFPNASKREGREAVYIAVEKLDPPGHGYKGRIPATSTLDYVARQWGDGNYTFTVLNHKGDALKKREAIAVSVGVNPADAEVNKPKTKPQESSTSTATSEIGTLLNKLIDVLNADKTNNSAAQDKLLAKAAELSKQHSDMVIQSSKDSASRDHDYHKTQLLAQEQLFKGIIAMVGENSKAFMAQMQQTHDNQTKWQDQSFRQMMTLVVGVHKQETSLLREQLEFAEEHSGGDGSEPWEKALTLGVSGIKELRMLASSATDITKKRALLKKVRMLKNAKTLPDKTPQNSRENTPKINQRTTVMRRRKTASISSAESEIESPTDEKPETSGDLG